MDDFPGNTHKREVDTPEPKEEPRRVSRITKGNATKTKKTLGRKFMEVFVGGDAKSVFEYIFVDVLVPALKDALVEAATQGIERTLFGDSRNGSRRPTHRSSTSSYTSYNQYSRPQPKREDSRPTPSTRRSNNYEDLVLPSRSDAESVLEAIYELLSRYGSVTVSDLYELTGVTPNFIDEKWGWYVLDGSRVRRVPNGWLLDLPRPEPLN
jgi:hypothetical protein